MDGKVSLTSVLHTLREHGAINYGQSNIYRAGMNVRDRPEVTRHLPVIVEHLYGQVAAAGIKYDAVVGVPTGGDAWARELAKIASAKERRKVPLVKLNKDGHREFSVTSKQPVTRKSKLLLVDDTIYMGRTSTAAVRVLTDAGFKIAGLVFPVEIGLDGREHWDSQNYPVFSTFNSGFIQKMSHQ